MTRANVTEYAEALQTRNAPMTVQGRIGQLARAMRAMAPHQDWGWLSRAADRIRAEAVPVREKRGRIQSTAALVDLGITLMKRAEETDDHFEVQRARLFRDGLMIGLLALRPIRRSAFSKVAIGTHLVRRDAGWLLVFSANDTKTKIAEEIPFPDELVPYLETYLLKHRPILLQRVEEPERSLCTALWIAPGKTGMSDHAIYVQICSHTKAAFGKSQGMHLFRDSLVTTIATEAGAEINLVPTALGHTTLKTSERHYNQARTVDAARRRQSDIQAMRGNKQRPQT